MWPTVSPFRGIVVYSQYSGVTAALNKKRQLAKWKDMTINYQLLPHKPSKSTVVPK